MAVPVDFASTLSRLPERQLPSVGGAAGGRATEVGDARRDEPVSDAPSFRDRLEECVQDVDGSHRRADAMAQDFADGKQNDIHGTMIAMQQADIKFRLAVNIRNKALEAYREIMRMGA